MMLIHPTLLEFDGNWPEAFKPTFHQYYVERIRDINDDLPKYDGKKGDEPINKAAEKQVQENETKKKKEDEKRSREEEEDNEAHARAAKRQSK
jgi:hypothetical protein